MKTTIDFFEEFKIPTELAVCPECGEKLTFRVEVGNEISGEIKEVMVICPTDEDRLTLALEENDASAITECHQYELDVWQPLTKKVLEWAQENYLVNYDMDI